MPKRTSPDQNGRRARHARHDGNPMGLTEAFNPITEDDYDETTISVFDDDFDEEKDFSFSQLRDAGSKPRPTASRVNNDDDVETAGDYDSLYPSSGSDAGSNGQSDGADGDREASNGEPPAPTVIPVPLYDEAGTLESGTKRGRHGRHAAPSSGSSRGSQEDQKEEIPAYLRKSRRTRRILIVVIILLIILLGVGGYFGWQLLKTAENTASQETQNVQQEVSQLPPEENTDPSTSTERLTAIPNLVSLLGMNQDQALQALQHGAQVIATAQVNEEGNPIRTNVRVALTGEPADSRTGTPTVYLGLNEAGVVVQAGYSTSTTSLGYGSISFTDAVKNEAIIETSMREAGVDIPAGEISLPDDKTSYSTYASDGTTLVQENCSFTGTVDINGAPHVWSAVLSYDYGVANATGNLADTVRSIYLYINA